MGGQWHRAYAVRSREGAEDQAAPELADLGRYGRRLVRRFVAEARADDQPRFATLIREHLGVPTDELGVAEELWPPYEHVNVQAALDAWLAEDGREHRLLGLANYRHRGPFGLADLVGGDTQWHGLRPGNLSWMSCPTGPDGQTRQCLRIGLVLVSDGADRLVLLYRAADAESDMGSVSVEVMATRDGQAVAVGGRLRELALERNVYRGQVVSFGYSMFGERGSALRFHARVGMARSDLVLPSETFDDLRRQVVGVARHRDRLRASRQHLKRGLLLYGPPGVGKTHTVRYLVGELTDTTVVELTGDTLHAVKPACSIARALQPAMIVVEDVDLIAELRDDYGGETPLLFTLLNEMDGLAEDADVVFLLTTNRPDLLEPALASRPGRVDQAVRIDLPDRDARRRLVELYRGRLELDDSRLNEVLERTDGVTASFLKELLRRAAVVAVDRESAAADGLDRPDRAAEPTAEPSAPIAVSADDLDAALDDLLDTRNQMTRVVLGARGDRSGRSDRAPGDDRDDRAGRADRGRRGSRADRDAVASPGLAPAPGLAPPPAPIGTPTAST